jgi:hypothetical protein
MNTIFITILALVVGALVAIRLYEDQKAAATMGLDEDGGFTDTVANFINYFLTAGHRCHKIPTVPTRRERIAKYERKALLKNPMYNKEASPTAH